MTYALTKTVLGFGLFIDISKDEYNSILIAKNCLFESLYLEEKLDIVVEDYLEFEMELLSSSIRKMVNRNQNYSWFHEEISKINRRLVNLLSACRLYLDHSMHHLSKIYGEKSDQIETIKKSKSEEYDSKLGYRVMEALRNYVQHRGFPVHKGTYNSKRVEKKEKDQILFTLTPFLKTEELELDNKFKKPVLEELKGLGSEIDLKPLAREYVAGIANVHEKIRAIIREDIANWENTLFSNINLFKEKVAPEVSILGLAAVRREENNTYNGIVPIFTEFIEHRRELEKKNRTLGALENRYVTSEIIQEKA